MPYKEKKDLSGLSESWYLDVPGDHHLQVFIWEDLDSMYPNINSEPDYLAHYVGVPYKIDLDTGKPALKPKVGEIHLVINRFGAGVFAHELQHFLLDWMGVWGLDWDKDNEKLCAMAGELTEQFWTAFYQHYEES